MQRTFLLTFPILHFTNGQDMDLTLFCIYSTNILNVLLQKLPK